MAWTDPLLFNVPIFGLCLLFAKAALIVMIGLSLASDLAFSAASVRHRSHVAVVMALALLPLATLILPAFELPILADSSHELISTAQPLVATLLAIYLVVAVAKGALLLLAVTRVALISAQSQPAPAHWQALAREHTGCDRLVIRCSDQIQSPVSWGSWRPHILLPSVETWSESDRRMVFLHELAHIRRGDWFVQLLGELVAILYWPVPGIRAAIAQLSLDAEKACDDFVIQQGSSPPDYAALLLRQARTSSGPALVAFSNPSELAQRIRNLCTRNVSHTVSLNDRTWLYPLCVLAIIPLATVQPVTRHTSFVQHHAGLTQPLNTLTLVTAENTGPGIYRPSPPSPVPAQPNVPPTQLGKTAAGELTRGYVSSGRALLITLAEPAVSIRTLQIQTGAALRKPP